MPFGRKSPYRNTIAACPPELGLLLPTNWNRNPVMPQQGRLPAGQKRSIWPLSRRSQHCGLNVPNQTHSELGVVVYVGIPNPSEAKTRGTVN